MSLLNKKLVRDLRSLKGQLIAVSLVMACGLAMMIMARSLVASLETNRDEFYGGYRFADVFARLTRAPESLAASLEAIPGVGAVETEIARYVTLDVPNLLEPATGLINSLPDRGEKKLNKLFIRKGRLPEPGGRREIVVSEPFAEAHGLGPGDTISAVLNGSRETLRITGIVLSPDFVFESRPGASLPDNKTFGVFWMPYTELATAFNMDGAFNSVAIRLAQGASEPAVLADVDRLLEPYGGRRAYGRGNHPSHVRLEDEIRIPKILSVAYPIVFLSVAIFMINTVMSRLVALQRDQIAILKAFGFTNRQVGAHYMKFSLAIVTSGTALGLIGGVILGKNLVYLYKRFFKFPDLEFVLDQTSILVAAAVGALAAMAGVISAVRKAVNLAPAEAMRPEKPAVYRKAFLERLGVVRLFSQSFRMSVRNIERKPAQALFTCLALSMATGLLVIPNAFRDAIDHILNHQWDLLQRQSATVALVEPGPVRVAHDFSNFPGVVQSEVFRGAAVELSSGHLVRRVNITGIGENRQLSRAVGSANTVIPIGPDTFAISDALAKAIGVGIGDEVELRALEGPRRTASVRVTALSEDFAGFAAYMDIERLNRILGEGDRISGAHLRIADGAWDTFLAFIKEAPAVGAVVIKDSLRDVFRKTTAENVGLIQRIYLFFATTVAFGIVYNGARISLSERARELATLRVIGFTKGEVGAVLVGELMIITLVAIPIGLVVGGFAAKGVTGLVQTEAIRIPLVLTASNFAFAVLIIIIATSISAFWAARKISNLDLVGVLKAQD